jgi:tRNA (adenine-N(1)-)-methyltransferase non-catalytic subunit
MKRKKSHHFCPWQQHRKGEKCKIARGSIPHDDIVGYPFGTRFQVVRGNRDACVTPCTEDSLADLLEEINQAEDSEKDADPNAKDNRELVDMNQLTKGRENSQKLGANEIEELRKSGMDGKSVMKSLIENSSTFKQKTDFSQEKWVKRKSAKHAPTFYALRCTSFSLCKAYFLKDPSRTCNLREDSLSRMLTMSNVQQGSRALVADSMNGMLVSFSGPYALLWIVYFFGSLGRGPA